LFEIEKEENGGSCRVGISRELTPKTGETVTQQMVAFSLVPGISFFLYEIYKDWPGDCSPFCIGFFMACLSNFPLLAHKKLSF
jgi:hypothetical protein